MSRHVDIGLDAVGSVVFDFETISTKFVNDLSGSAATARSLTASGALLCVAKLVARLTGYGRRKALGSGRLNASESGREKPCDGGAFAAFRSRRPADVVLRLRNKGGSTARSSGGQRPIEAGGGALDPGVLRDAPGVRPTDVTCDRAAGLDAATGSLDRRAFVEAVERRLKTRVGPTLIVKLDIVGFRDINVGYGFDVGDALLQETGRRLQRTGAVAVGRVGSDEFALAFDLSHKASAPRVAVGVSDALSRDFAIPGTNVAVRFAIGYAVGEAGCSASSLIRSADIALRSAKSAPLGGPRRFQRADEDDARRRVRMDRELALAIANDEFVHHFQPQIDFSTGACVGAEALIRRNHPLFGCQPPGSLIEAAERTGLLFNLGERGLAAVAAFARGVNERRARPLRFSVNVSATEFLHRDMATMLDRITRQTGAEPAWLTLEITEGVFLNHTPAVLEAFRRLRDLGVGLSVDDFGMGYSNLRLLEMFPVTEIKIDRRFVGELDVSPSRIGIVRSLIDLGRALGLAVVAEGVETDAQRALLTDMGCPVGQGHLFGSPVDAESFVAALGAHDPTTRADAAPPNSMFP